MRVARRCRRAGLPRERATLDELLARGAADDASSWSSVVPAVSAAIAGVARRRGASQFWSRTKRPSRSQIRVDSPAAVGDDRLVNALRRVAHLRRARRSWSTWARRRPSTSWPRTARSSAAPSRRALELGLDALARGTAQLPRVPLRDAADGDRVDTVTAMQSGAVIGYIGLVHELIRRDQCRARRRRRSATKGHPDRRPVGGGLGAGDPECRRRSTPT